MNMLQNKKTVGRGLSRIMTMIAGASALLMIAGSAQALSIDLSSYRGGNAQISAGDHTVSISESRTRNGRRGVSISINGGQTFSVTAVAVALRGRHSVIAVAGDDRERVRRQGRRGPGIAEFDDVDTNAIELFSRHRIRLSSIDIDVPNLPEPVTAVPEPGAALLFGAGIVLAGIRRR